MLVSFRKKKKKKKNDGIVRGILRLLMKELSVNQHVERQAIAMILAVFVRRMVLDPKVTSLHSDYGSFDRPLGAGEGHERDVEATVDGSSNGMAQSSDIYQRQPLLPGAPTKGKDKWSGVASGSDYYVDDEDEKIDSLSRHPGIPNGSGNGVVKLDIPAPLREEPRFPKEKWKTFLGKDKLRTFPILPIYTVWYTCRTYVLRHNINPFEKEGHCSSRSIVHNSIRRVEILHNDQEELS